MTTSWKWFVVVICLAVASLLALHCGDSDIPAHIRWVWGILAVLLLLHAVVAVAGHMRSPPNA